MGIGTQGAGSAITMNAASAVISPAASTNASGVTTVKDDTITIALAASAVGSTVNGGAGLDTITITPTIGALNASALYSNVEKVNFTVGNTGAFTLPTTSGMAVENKSATAALTVTLGAAGSNAQTVTSASAGLTTVAMANGQNSTVTVTGSGGLTATAVGGVAGQTLTNSGTGATAITATGVDFKATLGAANDSVTFLTGANTAAASVAAGGGTTDTAVVGAATNISAGTVSGFEILDQNTHTGATTTTMTIAQLAQFTGTNTTDNAADAVALSDAGTVGQQLVIPVYTLAAGTNIFNANTTAQTVTVTGGTTNTYNMGGVLDALDVITGAAATTDVLNVTGAGTGSANITLVDTINVNYATALTFTTGAITPGVASVVDASGSAGAVTLDLTGYVPTTTLVVTDGQAGDTITNVSTDAINLLTSISLATGGADVINYTNTYNAATNSELTITGFTSGTSAEADKLSITSAAAQIAGFTTLAAANTVVPVASNIYEIPAAIASVTDLTAVADGAAVEVAVVSAFNGVTALGVVSTVVLYGAGAAAGTAGIYTMTDTGAAMATGALAVELIAIVTPSGGADSFVASNFI